MEIFTTSPLNPIDIDTTRQQTPGSVVISGVGHLNLGGVDEVHTVDSVVALLVEDHAVVHVVGVTDQGDDVIQLFLLL